MTTATHTGDDLRQRAIGAYLDALGSSAPTPGGGSAGGVVAALGAALGEMVCALSAGRASGEEAEILRRANEDLRARRADAMVAAAADERAYAAYRAAVALPKGSDEERAVRRDAMQAALRDATDVPLALAEASEGILAALEPVAAVGTTHALADAQLAAYLATAALRGALLNIRGNAGMLRDPDAAARYLDAADRLERHGNALAEAVERAALARSG